MRPHEIALARPEYRFAFCGLYIVDEAFRGHGYGLAITDARLRYVGDRNARLEGVRSMVAKLERLGSRAAHRRVRETFTGVTRPCRTGHRIGPLFALYQSGADAAPFK